MTATRMYILVRDQIPAGFAAVSIAHAPIACYLQFKDDPHVQKWITESFRKAVVKVTDDQFEDAYRNLARTTLISESGFGGVEIALACAPRPSKKWPRWFADLPLWDFPLQEGDAVDVKDVGRGHVDTLQGWQDRPESIRVQIGQDCNWYAPHKVRRVAPDPSSLLLGLRAASPLGAETRVSDGS